VEVRLAGRQQCSERARESKVQRGRQTDLRSVKIPAIAVSLWPFTRYRRVGPSSQTPIHPRVHCFIARRSSNILLCLSFALQAFAYYLEFLCISQSFTHPEYVLNKTLYTVPTSLVILDTSFASEANAITVNDLFSAAAASKPAIA
jgi:hypothetical protein